MTNRKKTGGRQKGTANKLKRETKDWLNDLITSNHLQMEKDIKTLEPKERLQVFEKFMQYTIPKMQSVQTTVDFNKLTDEQLENVIKGITKGFDN
jgi:isopropylmalate/homocitrate/citramalate synthase